MAMYINKWIEHFFILPIKWFNLHCKSWIEQQQRCKVCGCRDKFNFQVQDYIWEKVVPKKYQNRVVCLACFDDFSKKNEVDYSASISSVYFAGKIISLEFQSLVKKN